MISSYLKARAQSGDCTYIDAHFADLMCRLSGSSSQINTFVRLSAALRDQHSCLDLTGRNDDIAALALLPTVGSGTGDRPLVLEGTRLYLQRYFAAEVRIAARLIALNQPLDVDLEQVRTRLAAVFPTASSQQQLAALIALGRRLTIITGGPGTGKTSTIANILSLLLDAGDLDAAAIRLAAPTGKAAMRLADALGDAGVGTDKGVVTLHRLLGIRDGGRAARYGPDRPLPVKLLIVDEVSMVDLTMMDRLLAALPSDARLILLGDPNQLPSVDTGNVLADICKYPAGYTSAFVSDAAAALGLTITAAPSPHLLADAICPLDLSYRFSPDRGIGKLSAAVLGGNLPEINEAGEVSITELTHMITNTLEDFYASYLSCLATGADAAELLLAFEKQRVLTPIRDGDFGVIALNGQIEAMLEARGLKTTSYYHGRPLLVTRNDYSLGLFNGDVGVCVARPGLDARVVFGDGREFLASRLPAHETCFAMTVHKSQGSEFDRVALVLPEVESEAQRGLLSREMLYTAITRTREQLDIYAQGEALERCIRHPVIRHSGLAERFLAN